MLQNTAWRGVALRGLALLVALTSGCSGGTEPPSSVAGVWSGSQSGVSVNVTLVQAGTTVTGSGTINSFAGSIPFTTSGSYARPDLSLTLFSDVYPTVTFQGTADGNEITGRLNGGALTQFEVVLRR